MRGRGAGCEEAASRPARRPLFVADWDDVTFVHFAFEPSALRPVVPFELDLFEGRAYVSLVAFTQRNLRPRIGGRVAALLSTPLATHEFLNVRTYVRHAGETGIYFLCEWIPNRLATWIGPMMYGLPYQLGRLRYRCDPLSGRFQHEVSAGGKRLAIDAFADPRAMAATADAGTRDAFLLERYVAFTRCRGRNTCFRVDHAPWSQRAAQVCLREARLLAEVGIPWGRATFAAANVSEGVKCVGLGAPGQVSGAR